MVLKKRVETGNYCFPKPLANTMMQITPRTQMEASILSMVFILIGLIIMGVYMTFFFPGFPLFMRIMTGINTLAGFFFLSSYLVTEFQKYKTYLLAIGVINEIHNERRLN